MKELSTLLSALSISALLCCGLILLFPWKNNFEKDLEASVITEKTLFRFSANELDQIQYEYQSDFDNFSLINQGNTFLFKIQENDIALPLDHSVICELLVLLENFPSGNAVSNILEDPDFKIRLLPTIGEKTELSVWQYDESIYISNGKETQEFSHAQVSLLLRKPIEYIDCQLTNTVDKSAAITIRHKLYEENLTLSYYIEENNIYGSLIAPTVSAVKEEQLLPIISSLHKLKADKALVLCPTNDELNSFGLSDPFCTFTLSGEEEKLSFNVSQPSSDGSVFLIKNGIPVIYKQKVSSLPWLFVSLETLTEKNIFDADYKDCIAFSIQTEQGKYRFTKWDGVVLYRNREINEESFKKLFKQSTNIIPSAMALSQLQEQQALMTLTFSYTNPDQPQDIIRFSHYNNEYLGLSINSNIRFLVKKDVIEEISTCLHRIIQ